MQSVTKKTILGVRLAVATLVAYWVAIFVGTHLPNHVIHGPAISDKLMHFSAFAGLGLLLCYITTSDRLVRRFSMIAAIGLCYAAADEWSQGFVKGRTTDVMDFLADAAGLFAAIAVYLICRAIYYRWTATANEPRLDSVG
ncbi:VanZ family protein [Novipirellula artificiosorum]|nr:VanZ family protein [Novipirellula artificiosorum]